MKRLIAFVLASRALAQVAAVQNPVPGATSSVNTLNPAIQVQGSYAGSIGDEKRVDGVLRLTLREAIQRGIRANLSPVQLQAAVREAEAQSGSVRSALLPNVSANLREVLTKTNLRAFGVRFPGAPTVVGPFNYFDLRATLTQSLFDVAALKNYRASQESVVAGRFRLADARDVVVLAVSGAYLQALTADARIRSAKTHVQTAETLYSQASQQHREGLIARVDANRSQVQLQVQQQRLITLENDLAKQKLNLARIIGLAPGQEFVLADDMPFNPVVGLTLDESLSTAYARRADLQAAQAAVRAAELRHDSARAQRLPSLSVSADYGAIGTNPAQAAGTYTVAGNLRIPLWAGGRVGAEIAQTAAQLDQRRAELANLRGAVDADIRGAFLDLESAASQVRVAQANLQVARESLDLTRQRFDAGIGDTAEVARAQETLASAEQDLITSQFAHNLAKALLAREIGQAEEAVMKLLAVP